MDEIKQPKVSNSIFVFYSLFSFYFGQFFPFFDKVYLTRNFSHLNIMLVIISESNTIRKKI